MKMHNRILAALLCALMLIGVLPSGQFAVKTSAAQNSGFSISDVSVDGKTATAVITNDEACRLVVAFGEMDGGHHADTHSQHHAQPVDKHHNRGDEIDGRQSVAADAVSDKNTVGKQECHVEKHAQQGGEEDAGKQTPNACLAEINVVSVVVHGGVLSGVLLLAMRKRQGAGYCRLPVSLLRVIARKGCFGTRVCRIGVRDSAVTSTLRRTWHGLSQYRVLPTGIRCRR